MLIILTNLDIEFLFSKSIGLNSSMKASRGTLLLFEVYDQRKLFLFLSDFWYSEISSSRQHIYIPRHSSSYFFNTTFFTPPAKVAINSFHRRSTIENKYPSISVSAFWQTENTEKVKGSSSSSIIQEAIQKKIRENLCLLGKPDVHRTNENNSFLTTNFELSFFVLVGRLRQGSNWQLSFYGKVLDLKFFHFCTRSRNVMIRWKNRKVPLIWLFWQKSNWQSSKALGMITSIEILVNNFRFTQKF